MAFLIASVEKIIKILTNLHTCSLTGSQQTVSTIKAVACGTAIMWARVSFVGQQDRFCYRVTVFLPCSLVGTEGRVD